MLLQVQIANALAKVTQLQRLPRAKPDIFTGDETDTKFFIWETAFDVLINSAPISAQQKLYLLYQHLDGNVKKVIEQLQYMVSASPEIAYTEARKKLKTRFGRPAIIATDFENKLANWPKVANNDAQGLQEFSDFLQQVEIVMNHLHSLKIFEYPSKLQTLVEKLPGWFLTKWSTKVQTLQQEKGCNALPTFTEFIEEVTFHADRMNIPQIFRQGVKNPVRQSLGTTPTTNPLPRKRIPGTTTMASKATGESKVPTPETKKEKSEYSSKDKDLCLFHKTKSHTLNECKKFQDLALDDRRDFFKKNKLCFKCMAYNKHNADKCDQTPPVSDICRKRHVTALHVEATPGSKDKLNTTTTDTKSTTTACTQVCGEEETSRSCARIVLVRAYHQSNPAKKITTYAVLDDQSTDMFIADALLEQLEVDATEVDLQVNTIVGSNSIRTKKVVGLSIQDLENEYGPIKVLFAYSREYIPVSHKDIATPRIVSQ